MNAVLKQSVLTADTKRLRDLEAVEEYIRETRASFPHNNRDDFGAWIIDGLTNFSPADAEQLFEHIKRNDALPVLEMVTKAIVSYYGKNAGIK